MPEIRAGNLVTLKGGGPTLTVTSIDEVNGLPLVFVCWFDDSGNLKRDHFEPEALKIFDPDA